MKTCKVMDRAEDMNNQALLHTATCIYTQRLHPAISRQLFLLQTALSSREVKRVSKMEKRRLEK